MQKNKKHFYYVDGHKLKSGAILKVLGANLKTVPKNQGELSAM